MMVVQELATKSALTENCGCQVVMMKFLCFFIYTVQFTLHAASSFCQGKGEGTPKSYTTF